MSIGCSILIVDDDPGVCTSLRDILQAQQPHRIDLASTGRDALAAAHSQSYDVVVLDVKLPDMPGLELVPQLEEQLPGAEILVITGYDPPDAAQAVRPSTVAYLTKPIDLERLLSVIDSIAQRKQLERENFRLVNSLRLAKVQWERTFDAISDPILLSDDSGVVQKINRAFSQRFAICLEDAVGVFDRILLFGPTSAFSGRVENLPAPGGRQERNDLAIPGVFEIACDAVELADGLGFLYVLRDVSERKEAEDALRRREAELFRAQKMEMVGRLASGIAHDFNNLLTIILSETDLALLRMHGEDPLHPRLQRISQAAHRSTELSKKLRGLGRMRSLQPQPCDLNAMLRASEGMIRRLLHRTIDLRMHLTPGLEPVEADPAHLEQILVNLVSNARDAMPDGGVLTLETTPGRPSQGTVSTTRPDLPPRPYVTLTVGDTGSGIDPAIHNKIFEPFFTTKRRGAGLGLSMVYGIVEQSEGQVDFDSRPGRTRFRVTLPLAAAELAEPPKPAPLDSPRAATVLFVDDNEPIRLLAVEMLDHAGYDVLSAEDGEQALEVLAEQHEPIDLLVTDVLMPKLDGQGLAERLWEQHPQVPVLFISGFPDQKLPPNAPYLQKPFTMQTLLLEVQEILAARSRS